MKYVIVIALIYSITLSANIKLGTIYNNTDLKLLSASTVQPTQTKITGLTSSLKMHYKTQSVAAKSALSDVVLLNYLLSSGTNGTVLFEAQDSHQAKYTIVVSANSSLAVQFNRKKTQHGCSDGVKSQCDASCGNLCVQVVIKKDTVVGFSGVLNQNVTPEENFSFDLTLTGGSSGIYSGQLTVSK